MQSSHSQAAVCQGTLTINAAFLQEIKDDNRELKYLLAECLAACQPDGWRKTLEPAKLLRLLGKLRDQLGMHFALEEAYGYFDDALSVAPQLSRRALELREQHRPLFLTLCQLVEDAERLRYHEPTAVGWRDVADAYADFHQQFCKHEAAEDRLVMQMVNEEIGCGD